MSIDYTTYDPATGWILRAGTTDTLSWALEQAEHFTPEGEPHIVLDVKGNRDTQYVVDGVLTDRPTIPDLASVPTGARVFVDGVDHGICDDGLVEIATDIAGTYRVRLDPPFPYQSFETDVTIP